MSSLVISGDFSPRHRTLALGTMAGREPIMTARLPASFLTGKRPRFPVSPKADRTLDGHIFDSKLECRRYAELRQREKAGIILELTLQPEFRIPINGHHFCT